MPAWTEFQFHELVQVPRPVTGPDGRPEPREATAGPLAASLTGAHADLLGTGRPGAALLTGWLRVPGTRRMHFLLGGSPLFPPAGSPLPSGEPYPVLFPPGATALGLPTMQVIAMLDPFSYWVPCVARPDALWEPAAKHQPPWFRRGSFDRHAAHLAGPFAWLVVAEPLPPGALDAELAQLVNEILPLTRGEVGEAKRVELERKRARHRELSRAEPGGGWRIRVLVGGADRRGATTAAAMLCAASELDGLPYVLEPSGPAVQDMPATSFTSGTELLVALTRPPQRELPGIRLVAPATFDVTAEGSGDGLRLGGVLDESGAEVGAMTLSLAALNRHTFVCGATGAGKSQTIRHLLAEATAAGVPWLVVEPAKAEYAGMAARIAGRAEVIVIRPGHPDSPPAGFNPLEPAPGFGLQTHADLLRALFQAAFEAQEPFPQILAKSLTRCYEELGWDLTIGEPVEPGHRPRYPTLRDLQRVAANVVTEIGYGKEIADNVRGFIAVRVGSLRLGTTGRFFEGGHPLDFDRLRERNVVLEIEDVGDDADKAFLMGAVLMRLSEQLRVAARQRAPQGLGHLTVIEEAHRLLRRSEPGAAGAVAKAVELFANMLAEVRAYGEGLIIAEQIPSKLTPDVIKNTAVKIVHRLPAADDRDSVGATMNVDEAQSRYVVTLVPGTGAVFTDGMDSPILVRVPDGSALERAASVPTAPVAGLIGRRSATCGADCVATACTLRQMRDAQRLLAGDPWLTVWAELALLAHLTNQPIPVPKAGVRTGFVARIASARSLDCALSHAVDQAVAVRSPVLQPSADPAELAEHVVAALGRMLRGEPSGCAGDGARYVATPYRWERIRAALLAGPNGQPPDQRLEPDPRSPEWEKAFRRPIPGDTWAAQLDAVTGWLATDLGDPARRDAVTFGTARPSALEEAIGTGEGWTPRVTAMLAQFEDCAWPLLHLHVQPELVNLS